jgi:hypothetical protein
MKTNFLKGKNSQVFFMEGGANIDFFYYYPVPRNCSKIVRNCIFLYKFFKLFIGFPIKTRKSVKFGKD